MFPVRLRVTVWMVGSHIDSSFVLAFLQLDGMSRSICIIAPIFRMIIEWIDIRPIGKEDIFCDFYRIRPRLSFVAWWNIPTLFKSITFQHFRFTDIACVVKQENSSVRVVGIHRVKHWSRIADLQCSVACYSLDCAPCFSIVMTSFHNNLNVSEISGSIYSPFTKRQKVTFWKLNDGWDSVTLITVLTGWKYNCLLICFLLRTGGE